MDRREGDFESVHEVVRGEDVIGRDKRLGDVFLSGRFSALKTLRILSDAGVVGAAGALGSKSLAEAFRGHLLADLGTLSLPAYDAMTILEALTEGSVSPSVIQLRSLSVCLGRIDDMSRLDAVFRSRCLHSLQHLHLSHLNGFLWKALAEALKCGALPNVRSFRISNSALRGVDLADLATDSQECFCSLENLVIATDFQEWFCSLENLAIVGCDITSKDFCPLVGSSARLALKSLDLHDNDLDYPAVNDLMNLATDDQLPLLKELDLSKNLGLLKFYRRRVCLCNFSKLNWEGNRISNGDLEPIVEFYYSDPTLTAELHISWNLVSDLSLRTKLKMFRDRNVRLVSFWTDLEEDSWDRKPLNERLIPYRRVSHTFRSCNFGGSGGKHLHGLLPNGNVVLCGYPEVGKTELSRTLLRCIGITTRFLWKTRPKIFSKERRTTGIELSRVEKEAHGKKITLTLWDLDGQEDYHILHGTLLADPGLATGKATTFVLVFRAPFGPDVEAKLLYWLRFVASMSWKHARGHLVIILNCSDSEERLWAALIKKSASVLSDLLDIELDPFVIDVRVAVWVRILRLSLSSLGNDGRACAKALL